MHGGPCCEIEQEQMSSTRQPQSSTHRRLLRAHVLDLKAAVRTVRVSWVVRRVRPVDVDPEVVPGVHWPDDVNEVVCAPRTRAPESGLFQARPENPSTETALSKYTPFPSHPVG